MPEAEQVYRLEADHSKIKTITDIVTLAITVVGTYYCLDPDGFEHNYKKVVTTWKKIRFKVSVWQTAEAINSLPVTDITDDTRNNGVGE